MLVPTLLYGCETWTVQKCNDSILQIADDRDEVFEQSGGSDKVTQS